MDALHKPDDKYFITPVVSVPDFAAEAAAAGVPLRNWAELGETALHERLADIFGLSEAEISGMAVALDPKRLRCTADYGVVDKLQMPPDMKLETLKAAGSLPALYQYDGGSEVIRQTNVDFVEALKKDEASSSSYSVADSNEVVLTVVCLRPSSRPRDELYRGSAPVEWIFRVLGNQKLTQLRDAIKCPSEKGPIGDLQYNMNLKDVTVTGDIFKGGFFYINGVFYNDYRDPNATDLSEPIIEWAKRRPQELGPFRKAKMEEVAFKDLQLRLGQPYLYMHQGQCEHQMIFTDIRLIHESDPCSTSLYPIQISHESKHWTRCNLCKRQLATWSVSLEDGAPFPTLLLCEHCYKSFCVDEEGKSIRKHTLAPYYGRRCSRPL